MCATRKRRPSQAFAARATISLIAGIPITFWGISCYIFSSYSSLPGLTSPRLSSLWPHCVADIYRTVACSTGCWRAATPPPTLSAICKRICPPRAPALVENKMAALVWETDGRTGGFAFATSATQATVRGRCRVNGTGQKNNAAAAGGGGGGFAAAT